MSEGSILDKIDFEAVYEDGRRIPFKVSRWVKNGDVDRTAKTVAADDQKAGRLPAGRITSVERSSP